MDIDVTLLIQLGLLVSLLLVLGKLILKPTLQVIEDRHHRMFGQREEMLSLLKSVEADNRLYGEEMRQALQKTQAETEQLKQQAREEERQIIARARTQVGQKLAAHRQILTEANLQTQAEMNRQTDE